MSGRRDREGRREEGLREEQRADADERRQRLIKLASAATFLALVAVAVLIVVSGGNSGGDASNIVDAKEVSRDLAGIPQKGMVLGDPKAKVTVFEFGDLQCSVCKGYAEGVLPQVIESQVRSGTAKLDFRNFTIIDSRSTSAGAAAIAAGEQGRGWNYIEIFYRNQGAEHSDYIDDEFLTAVAKAAGVPDIAKWERVRKRKAVIAEVEATTAEAQGLGFTGTPSFALEGPATKGIETIETPNSADALESAIEGARKQR